MTVLTASQIAACAQRLYQAEKQRQQVPAVSQAYPAMDMDDAYAIQSDWVSRKVAEGDRVIGYKIGLTSRVMQRAMKINEPDFGVLLESMRFRTGAQIIAADFLDPRIEVELAFVLKRRLFGTAVGVDEVLEATDYIVPALELIAARSFRVDPGNGYVRTVMDTIADNAANAGIIFASGRFAPADVDFRWSGGILYLNDVVEETGLAAAVLDHPANGISWAARRFARHGIALEAGQVILSGSFTAPVPVRAGDRVCVDYGRLGRIECSFT